jgi:hypothetical protein
VDALLPGDSGWGVFIVEEVDRAGSKVSVEVTEDSQNHCMYWMLSMAKLPDMVLFTEMPVRISRVLVAILKEF